MSLAILVIPAEVITSQYKLLPINAEAKAKTNSDQAVARAFPKKHLHPTPASEVGSVIQPMVAGFRCQFCYCCLITVGCAQQVGGPGWTSPALDLDQTSSGPPGELPSAAGPPSSFCPWTIASWAPWSGGCRTTSTVGLPGWIKSYPSDAFIPDCLSWDFSTSATPGVSLPNKASCTRAPHKVYGNMD